MTPNWEKVRKEFAVTRGSAYFQSAGMSPIPRAVYSAIRLAYKKIYHSGDRFWQQDLDTIREFGASLAEMTGGRQQDITFMPNTSMGFSLVAMAMKKEYGGDFNIVTMHDEFPASNVPFEFQGIKVKFVQPENHRYPVELIANQIDINTRAIVCSFVQYGTGYRHNLHALGQLAAEKGILFIVNATQGFPIFPIAVEAMNIDVLSASLHKWGCAAHVGAMFYTSEEFRLRFPVPMAGWLSVKPPEDDFIPTQRNGEFSLFPDAMQYQMGTSNLQNLMGLKAAFEYMGRIGWKDITSRILQLSSLLVDLLKDINGVEIISPHSEPSEMSGIISINLKDKDNQKCVEFLESHNVITTIRQKNIRIACNYFNNEEDIQRLINGVKLFLCRE